MPNIHIDTRQFSGVDPGLEPDDGSVWFWPYRPYVEDSALVSKQIVKVKTVDGIAAPFLPQTPVGQAVWVQLRAIKGAGAPWLIQVPGTDCNLFDLPHIDPESLDPEVVPDPYWLTYMNTAIAEAIDGILDGAPAAMDTLAELAAALGDDPNFATTIITSLGEKVDQTTYDTAITAINTALGDKQPIATLAADVAPHVSDGSALDVAVAAKITTVFNLDDVGYDIVVAFGQSNMAGRGMSYDLTHFDPVDPRIFAYGSPTALAAYASVISQAVEPLSLLAQDGATIGAGSQGMGPALVYARWLAGQTPLNRRILIVTAAQGGTAFEGGAGYTWLVGGAAGKVNLYANTIAQTQAALAAAGANARVVGAIWIQGESDGTFLTPAANYRTDLDALIDATRTDLGIADLPFIVGQTPYESRTDTVAFATNILAARVAIDAVHIDTPRRKTRTGFAYAPVAGFINSDSLHFNAAGQRLIGKSMWQALARAKANITGTAPLAPTALTAVQTGTALTVSWSRTTSRVTDYNVQYRLVGAGSWTALTRAQSIDKSATITGLTLGSSYDVQVQAVNEDGTSAWSTTGTFALASIPGQVTGLTAGTPTASTVPLSWTAVAGATSYKVEQRIGAGSWSTVAAAVSGTAYTAAGLVDTTGYGFRVSATNAAGTGTASTETTATTASPTIYFADTFTAADGTAMNGRTTPTGAKTWVNTGTAAVAQIASNRLHWSTLPSSGQGNVVADAGVSDCVVRVTQAVVGANHGSSIVLRYVDDSNQLLLAARTSGSDFTWRLLRRVAGAATQLAAFGVASADGDAIVVTLLGSTITVSINGVAQTPVTETNFQTATKFGVQMAVAGSGGDTTIAFDDYSVKSS